MSKFLLPLCAALLLLPAAAFAAPAASNDEGARVDDSGEVRELIFDDGDNVDGETLSPTGAHVGGIRHKELESMITIRPHFLPELVRLSADI